jgi:hypothetical protein
MLQGIDQLIVMMMMMVMLDITNESKNQAHQQSSNNGWRRGTTFDSLVNGVVLVQNRSFLSLAWTCQLQHAAH